MTMAGVMKVSSIGVLANGTRYSKRESQRAERN